MSLGRRARRERISAAFDAFHAAMGAVLGSAARLTDTAAQEHALTMVETWLRHDGLDAARADPRLQGVLANPRLAAAVARVAADRDAAFEEWLTPHGPDGSGPQRLAALMAEHAPGRAGDVDGWLPQHDACSEIESTGPLPQLWRIGTGIVGAGSFPVGASAARRVAPADRPALP